MPAIAVAALELGHDGRSLRRLAGLDRPTRRDVSDLVDGALRELGVGAPMTRRNANLWMATHVAREIIEGRLEPYLGACRIWLTYSFDVPELSDWSRLVVEHEAASNADEAKKANEQIIRSARSLCLELLDGL
jgi:hypothetical protein